MDLNTGVLLFLPSKKLSLFQVECVYNVSGLKKQFEVGQKDVDIRDHIHINMDTRLQRNYFLSG